jgi:hypothetical protein
MVHLLFAEFLNVPGGPMGQSVTQVLPDRKYTPIQEVHSVALLSQLKQLTLQVSQVFSLLESNF